MSQRLSPYVPPSTPIIRWLADPGSQISPEIRNILIGELLSSPFAVVMATLNCLIIKVVAVFIHFNFVFISLAIFEVVLGLARFAVNRSISKTIQSGGQVSVDLSLIMSIVWCALQGTTAFFAMKDGPAALQTLSAALIMGMIGPICARTYPAPRFAFALVCLCDVPFVVGTALAGDPWLLVMFPMMPLFLLGVMKIIHHLHGLAVSKMISELASEDRARRDPLTGLFNRSGFREALERMTAQKSEFVLFCLDLDGFKTVNDTFGHHTGDSLLVAVAERLMACVSSKDCIARIGGDEFVILAEDLSTEAASKVADRIITKIMSEPYTFEGATPISIGVSVGFACAPDDASHADELHRKADAALYVAKAGGKGIHRRCQREQRHPTAPALVFEMI